MYSSVAHIYMYIELAIHILLYHQHCYSTMAHLMVIHQYHDVL